MKLVKLPRDALLKPLQAVTGIVERRQRVFGEAFRTAPMTEDQEGLGHA